MLPKCHEMFLLQVSLHRGLGGSGRGAGAGSGLVREVLVEPKHNVPGVWCCSGDIPAVNHRGGRAGSPKGLGEPL